MAGWTLVPSMTVHMGRQGQLLMPKINVGP